MYKVKRFSQISDFENFVLTYLSKKLISKDGLEVDDDDMIFTKLTSIQKSNLQYILKNIQSIAKPAIIEYEDKLDDLSIAKDIDNFDSLLNEFQVFDISLDGSYNKIKGCHINMYGKKFKDWMGWYDVMFDLDKRTVWDIMYYD